MVFIAEASGFWGFCCDHPILAIVAAFIILVILSGICMAGNSPPSIEWLKNTASDAEGSIFYNQLYRCTACSFVGFLPRSECERDHPYAVERVYYSRERCCAVLSHQTGKSFPSECHYWGSIEHGVPNYCSNMQSRPDRRWVAYDWRGEIVDSYDELGYEDPF